MLWEWRYREIRQKKKKNPRQYKDTWRTLEWIALSQVSMSWRMLKPLGGRCKKENTDMTLIFELVPKGFYGYVGLCNVVSLLEISDVYGQWNWRRILNSRSSFLYFFLVFVLLFPCVFRLLDPFGFRVFFFPTAVLKKQDTECHSLW